MNFVEKVYDFFKKWENFKLYIMETHSLVRLKKDLLLYYNEVDKKEFVWEIYSSVIVKHISENSCLSLIRYTS